MIKCCHCETEFEKPLKEYTRRVKNGYTVFFCSRACSGYHNISNLPDPNDPIVRARNIELLKKYGHRAKGANTKYTRVQLPFQAYLRKVQRRRKHDCDLSVDYLLNLWEQQGGRCAISGIPLQHPGRTKDSNIKASLDRIDSSKGYIEGNVQFLSCAMNWAKNNETDADLRNLIALIKLHS